MRYERLDMLTITIQNNGQVLVVDANGEKLDLIESLILIGNRHIAVVPDVTPKEQMGEYYRPTYETRNKKIEETKASLRQHNFKIMTTDTILSR